MLTELEGAVLSILSRKQPLSTYAIRQEFEAAVTQSWSASAGAIYPLVERLVKSGLLVETKQAGDGRGTKLLELTEKGWNELVVWITIDDAAMLGPVADPMRIRSFALPAVPQSEHSKIFDQWRAITLAAISGTQDLIARYESQGDHFAAKATRGTELQLSARLDWLDELISKLNKNQ